MLPFGRLEPEAGFRLSQVAAYYLQRTVTHPQARRAASAALAAYMRAPVTRRLPEKLKPLDRSSRPRGDPRLLCRPAPHGRARLRLETAQPCQRV